MLKPTYKGFIIDEKWIRFHADVTNGWQQHTVGSSSYQKESNMLTNKNENNFNNPLQYKTLFKVKLYKSNMTLQGKEEEIDLTIVLDRTNKLPKIEANKVLGLWKFDSIYVVDKETLGSLNPTKNAMISLIWENSYILYNYPQAEKYGIFKTHSTRKQIDLIDLGRK